MAAVESPFPAKTHTSDVAVAGVPTVISRVYFADKIVITATQAGRLSHWVHVPLANTNAATSHMQSQPVSTDDQSTALLPMSHLTATTILGGTKPEMEILGQALATNVASAILSRCRDEERLLVLGLGLDPSIFENDGLDTLLVACVDML